MDIKEILSEIRSDNKKLIGTCCGLIILLGIIGAIVSPPPTTTNISNGDENLFNQSIVIKTSQWDYNPEGYFKLGKDVYGTCEGIDSNGKESTYLFTDKQIAALGNVSNYTFEFKELHITYEDNENGNHIVTHLFYENGTEIPLNWDKNDFDARAKTVGDNNSNCVDYFGYTIDEMNRAQGY